MGSVNAVYQYLIKYAHENGIPYGRTHKGAPLEERTPDDSSQRPPRISIERTSRKTNYDCLLNVASTQCEEIGQALLGIGPKAISLQTLQGNSEDWDVTKLDCFINDYTNDSTEPLSIFASGLRKDYEAVKNIYYIQR